MRRLLFIVAPIGLFSIDWFACNGATEISFVVTTDLPCSAITSTAVSVGTLGSALDSKPADAVSTVCQTGALGTLVVTPTGSSNEELGARIVTGINGTSADTCIANGLVGNCIVARRALHFISHTPVTVDVAMTAACIDNVCDPNSTCKNGLCGDPSADCEGGSCAGAAAITPTTIVPDGGAIKYVPGYSTQIHLIYAEKAQEAWFFYIDDKSPTLIKARKSSDFVAWSDAGSIDLGGTFTNGSNFGVGYALLGGNDVVHVVANVQQAGAPYAVMHVRTTISNGALATPDIAMVPGSDGDAGFFCVDDGPSTIIASDGRVFDVTAWTPKPTNCDTNVYRSQGVDNGSSFTAGFTQVGYYVSFPSAEYNHQLLNAGAQALVAFPDQDNVIPQPRNYQTLGYAFSSDWNADGGPGVSEQPDAELFGAPNEASHNDWAVCHLSDTDIRAVRNVVDDPNNPTKTVAFEEERYDGTSWALSTSPPAAVPGAIATGVVMVSAKDPVDGILLATIASDNAIHLQRWTASGWSTVATFPGSAARTWIAGSGCGSLHPRIVWAEGPANGPYAVMGADVSAFLRP